MSLYGIRPPGTGSPLPLDRQPSTSQRPRVDEQRAPGAVPAPAATPNKSPAGAQPALPVQPPPGTDPELWSVLSAEERVFFAKLGAMGPLTYGRVLSQQQSPTLPAARGGRLDVKV